MIRVAHHFVLRRRGTNIRIPLPSTSAIHASEERRQGAFRVYSRLVHAAGTAADAVVFVELMLSQNNGFQLIRALANLPHVSLFLLTGTKRSTDLQWGLCAGAKAVLKRPLTLAVLRNALQSLQLLPILVE